MSITKIKIKTEGKKVILFFSVLRQNNKTARKESNFILQRKLFCVKVSRSLCACADSPQ